jgi:hypothetical protein
MKELQLNNNIERNAQNKHMTSMLHKSQCAVNLLVNRGMTVVDISLNGSRPAIEIQYQSKCELLNGTSRGYKNTQSGLSILMIAILGHCEVNWMQPAYIDQIRSMQKKTPKNNKFNYNANNKKAVANG